MSVLAAFTSLIPSLQPQLLPTFQARCISNKSTDPHTTQTAACHNVIIHCTDYTHTAATNQTHFISLGLPLSDRRVLSAFITLLAIATLKRHAAFPEFKSSLSCFFTCLTFDLILAWFTSS